MCPGDQRWLSIRVKIILIKTVFVSDLKGVTMPFCDDQCCFCATPLNERVSRKRGAMGNQRNLTWQDRSLLK